MFKRTIAILAMLMLLATASFASVGIRVDGTMQGQATDLNFPSGTTVTFDGSTYTITLTTTGLVAGITSGTINGATIGASSPSTGAFTTLTTSSTTTLGDGATDIITVTGKVAGATPLHFDGNTADTVYNTFAITDPTGARTTTFADASGTVMLSSLATNAPDAANSVTGASNALVMEGATADAYETSIAPTDPTADRTITLPDASGTAMVSSLATNAPDAANGVSGASNGVLFEGATADAYETTLSPTDPTADRTITLPDAGGMVVVSSLTTNAFDAANAVNLKSNGIEFEGSTADAYETTVTVTDPTADRTITIPDRTGAVRVATAMATITAGTTPSVDLSTASIFVDTPNDNEDQTITGTGAATIPGAITTIKFIGTASADEVITFGTGFKSTGTLTVGTAGTNMYTVTFVSDGTSWIELARTATQS